MRLEQLPLPHFESSIFISPSSMFGPSGLVSCGGVCPPEQEKKKNKISARHPTLELCKASKKPDFFHQHGIINSIFRGVEEGVQGKATIIIIIITYYLSSSMVATLGTWWLAQLQCHIVFTVVWSTRELLQEEMVRKQDGR